MDANGQRFWLLADEAQWHRWGDPPSIQYDEPRRSLRLAGVRSAQERAESRADALSLLERAAQAIDQFGTRASWDPASETVLATGGLSGSTAIFAPPLGQALTDLAIGYDGVLYVALGERVIMQDRRDRWSSIGLELEGFRPWRLAPDPTGGVWVLDRTARRLGRVRGHPLPRRPYGPYAPGTFRPCEENPDPPRMTAVEEAVFTLSETPVAIACSEQGRVGVLIWNTERQAWLRCLEGSGRLGEPIVLRGVRHPFSLTWVTASRVAVLTPGARNADVYDLGEQAKDATQETPVSLLPVGDYYPLQDHDGGPFLNGVAQPPHYPTQSGSAPLHRLSLTSFARRGDASNRMLIDSGGTQTEWHRLYLEAAIPEGCSVQVWLAASDEPAAPLRSGAWHEHCFAGMQPGRSPDTAQGAWVSMPSELPYHPGLLACQSERDRSGLFTVLIQRPGRRVRALRGRYLWVRVQLSGNGRASPELAALRAYGSRFSYVNQYLPELYREGVFPPDADELGPSTPADFLERFLGNLEGVLTPLEDRIAAAYLLTDPRTTPEDALEWLATWIGLSFDAQYPAPRRRHLLREATKLYRWRGTVQGLTMALNLATDGAVRGGEIVILEDFRLRRTFATILGADLADEQDPLLGGLAVSGNSYVGDTLFLGAEHRKEFLALFAEELNLEAEEQDAVEALFDRLANRVTVLVHEAVEPQDLGLIRRIVELETPAHVLARVLTTTHPFLVGMASLVGVDTYLAERPGPRAVRLGGSRLGVRDTIRGLPSLDPRLGDGPRESRRQDRPVANAGEDRRVPFGSSFVLDGSGSRTGSGRRITRYVWERTE